MSQAPEPFLLRVYDPEADYLTLCEWWRARGKEPPLKELLPKLAVVAHRGGEDYAMGFLYMDNSSPVCFFEMPISKPGMGVREARRAFGAIVNFLKQRAVQLGYGVMYAYARPALANEGESMGFEKQADGLTMLCTVLKGGA